MRVHRVLLRRLRRGAVLVSALLVVSAVTATAADAGTTVTGWGSNRQVALAAFNGRLYMAWIDPHANNELTITSTTDGINFAHGTHPLGSGNSNSAPALASFNGRLWLAWTGTDSNSTLNLSSSADGVNFTQAAQPLGRNNSPDGPALAVFNSRLYYGWKGTNAGQTLNLASSANGSTFSAPIQPGLNSSINAPALAVSNGKLYMAWSGTDQNHTINLASSTDGVNFSQFALTGYQSNFEPSMSPDPANGSLYIDEQNPIQSTLEVLDYLGGQSIDPFVIPVNLVEAPAVTAYGSTMVHAWLGTDSGHTIHVCFMGAAYPYC